jgi:hypothetical protein
MSSRAFISRAGNEFCLTSCRAKWVKVFWFFFSKKEQHFFFEKKKQKTFVRLVSG